MYITHDYRCVECGEEESRFTKKQDIDSQLCADTGRCGSTVPMVRLPAGTRTTFRFADRKLKA